MQPARFRQADFLLVEINNAKSMRPAVSSGKDAESFPEQRLVIKPISTFALGLSNGLTENMEIGQDRKHLYFSFKFDSGVFFQGHNQVSVDTFEF